MVAIVKKNFQTQQQSDPGDCVPTLVSPLHTLTYEEFENQGTRLKEENGKVPPWKLFPLPSSSVGLPEVGCHVSHSHPMRYARVC